MNTTNDAVRKDDQRGASTNLGAPSDQDLSVSGPSDQDLSIATPTDLSRTNIAAPSDQDLAQIPSRDDINGSDPPMQTGASSLVDVPAEYKSK